MVASHSACAGLNPHYRCKPDEVIRAIAETGYIGICCLPVFLGGTCDITAMLDHIDYAVKKFGAEYVAIGSDVAYTSRFAGQQELRELPKTRASWQSLWGPEMSDPEWRNARQTLSMAWTNWPLFTVGMVQRGYSDEDIQKILGGNVLRVAHSVFPEPGTSARLGLQGD